MLNIKSLFFQNLAQTSSFPLAFEIARAKGVFMFSPDGKKHLDLISGISVSNVGHCHPKVVEAVKTQSEKFMHLMVYGELIQSPQVTLAGKLLEKIPAENTYAVYLVNSGSEAIEGAMKIAKRYTGRHEIVFCKNAYHGSTQGALSIIGNESFKQRYRPLLPGTRPISFNDESEFVHITQKTAAVIVETVQGEAGYKTADPLYFQRLAAHCKSVGALLVLDEIQAGMGRTGSFYAFAQYGIVPDVFTLAKGLGGGMPIGAFVAKKEIMDVIKENPMLGHITTFGGHPVSCAAALAAVEVLETENLLSPVPEKEKRFRKNLRHPAIKSISGKGLMLAVEMESFDFVQKVIHHCLELGLLTDWFLFNDRCLRIAPPLIIINEEIDEACEIILSAIDHSL